MKEYVWTIDVAWAHCDAAGIVFYPNFYQWFDLATERLFTSNRLSYGELNSDFGISGMPLVESGASYKNKCALGDKLEVRTWVDEWGNRSFLVRHHAVHENGTPALEGFERRVFSVIDPASPKGMRALEIPDAIKKRFEN